MGKVKKIVSIGCGGAGMFSAIVATQLKKNKFESVVLSDERDIYCRCTSPYIITGEANVGDAIQPDSMIESYGPKILHEKAEKIDTNKKQVTTGKGTKIDYDYLVIATGASPYKPEVKGIDSENVFTVRNSSDLESIQECMKNANSVAVVGAGVIGIEMAGAFKSSGMDVKLFEYAENISSSIADKEFAEKIAKLLENNGIELSFGSEVVEINDVDGKKEVVYLKNENKETHKADFVVVAAGVRPNLEILKDTNINHSKEGILVDRKMQTNVKNVYACGDCAVSISAVTCKNVSSNLASTAIQQSKIVGFQMAGFPINYGGTTGAFAFKTLGKEYASAGLIEEDARKEFRIVITGKAQTTDIYKDLDTHEDLEVKLIFAGPFMRLVGYEAFGKGVISSAEVASFAIGLRLNILKLMKFNYIAHPSLTPWPFMNPIIMATEDAMNNAMQKLKRILNKK